MASDPHCRVLAIAAMDEGRVIGSAGKLPWHIPEDMQRFSALTRGHTVLMGRKTYESLPPKYRPLPHRTNVIASRALTASPQQDVLLCSDPRQFLRQCKSGIMPLVSGCLWVIGGEEIYRATYPEWDEVYLTHVQGRHLGDAFFPEFEREFKEIEREDHGSFCFVHYTRKMA